MWGGESRSVHFLTGETCSDNQGTNNYASQYPAVVVNSKRFLLFATLKDRCNLPGKHISLLTSGVEQHVRHVGRVSHCQSQHGIQAPKCDVRGKGEPGGLRSTLATATGRLFLHAWHDFQHRWSVERHTSRIAMGDLLAGRLPYIDELIQHFLYVFLTVFWHYWDNAHWFSICTTYKDPYIISYHRLHTHYFMQSFNLTNVDQCLLRFW